MNPSGNRAQDVVLRLDGITKRFGMLVANDAINLTVSRGEVVALLGENGAGKTTLMNILFGHYVADAGSVQVFGKSLPAGDPRAALAAGVGMVHQHFTLCDNLTVLDNIRLGTEGLFGRHRAGVRARVLGLARDFGLSVDPDARVGNLGVGQRQRVEILKALYRDARILILDEPTAVLTPQEATALFDTLRKATARGVSVVFISHKLAEVIAVADRCVVLRQGRVVGDVATAFTNRAALAALMVGAEVALPVAMPAAPGAVLLHLHRVSGGGLQDVSLNLRAGQITGLAGVSGNGQAALADMIAGLIAPVGGEINVQGRKVPRWSARLAIAAGVGRIPEDRQKSGSVADFTLTENAVLEVYYKPQFSTWGWMNWRAAARWAQSIIAGYDVRCAGPGARMGLLSGGNMQKLILGRVLTAAPVIILANQPVRGLDVGAIAYVQARLIAARDAGAAVLLISEDLEEIQSLADVVQVMTDGRISPEFARGALTTADLGLWMAGLGQKMRDAA